MEVKALIIQLVLQFVWTIQNVNSVSESLPGVCSSCPGSLVNSSVVVEQCGNLSIVLERCCVKKSSSQIHNGDVLGIDLSSCGLTELNNSLLHLVNVVTVAVANNSIKGDLQSQFYGLSSMEYLSLPAGVECPGGNDSWDEIVRSDNQTLCQGQIDLCVAHNFSCPKSSHCVPRGPGLKDCLCDTGYYGYKCLREGQFPLENFGIGLAVATVALSAFLWITQRRHARKGT